MRSQELRIISFRKLNLVPLVMLPFSFNACLTVCLLIFLSFLLVICSIHCWAPYNGYLVLERAQLLP